MTDRSLDRSGTLTRFFDPKVYGWMVMAKAG
jgi:hypothetical protein